MSTVGKHKGEPLHVRRQKIARTHAKPLVDILCIMNKFDLFPPHETVHILERVKNQLLRGEGLFFKALLLKKAPGI